MLDWGCVLDAIGSIVRTDTLKTTSCSILRAYVDHHEPFIDCTALLSHKPRLANRLALNKAVRELKAQCEYGTQCVFITVAGDVCRVLSETEAAKHKGCHLFVRRSHPRAFRLMEDWGGLPVEASPPASPTAPDQPAMSLSEVAQPPDAGLRRQLSHWQSAAEQANTELQMLRAERDQWASSAAQQQAERQRVSQELQAARAELGSTQSLLEASRQQLSCRPVSSPEQQAIEHERRVRQQAEDKADGLVEAWNMLSGEFDAAKQSLEIQLGQSRQATAKAGLAWEAAEKQLSREREAKKRALAELAAVRAEKDRLADGLVDELDRQAALAQLAGESPSQEHLVRILEQASSWVRAAQQEASRARQELAAGREAEQSCREQMDELTCQLEQAEAELDRERAERGQLAQQLQAEQDQMAQLELAVSRPQQLGQAEIAEQQATERLELERQARCEAEATVHKLRLGLQTLLEDDSLAAAVHAVHGLPAPSQGVAADSQWGSQAS